MIEEREKQKEEKRIEAIRIKEWNKPREDLELDDLKDLPKTTPVAIKLPSELFGDMMMVLEFLRVFGSLFDIRDEFPSGLSFAMLEEALTEHDAEGVYYDLLLFLLGAILRTHLEEEEDEGLDGTHDHEPLMDVDDDGNEKSLATVSASATMAAAWPMQHQGKPLHELIMDPFTSSELLRLHLLSSGARIGCGESSYRWQRRGGFTYSDDAGVEFRHTEPQLLKALVTGNIYDMGAEDKLKILVALCTQLITYATARDYVEDGFDQCRKVRREWQEDQWADQRKGKEEAAARYRRKQEERQRQKEELEKRKKEKDQERINGAKGESSAKPEDGSKNVSEQNEGDQTKKGGKKTAKRRMKTETKETTNTDNNVNGNKTTDDKEGDSVQVPVLTKEEEEEVAQQRQDERKRKDQEFLNQLTKAVCRNAIQPLGRDRVFRRYWTFRSLRGLFVEDDDPDQHLLLEPESDTESEDNEDKESGDEQQEEGQENSTLDPSNSDNTKKEEKRLVNGHTERKNTMKNEHFEQKVLNMFKAYQLTKRNFCKEDIDNLLDSLNSRGCREKPLRDAIQQEYKHLTIAVEKCPLKAEILAQKKESKPKGRRGGRNQPAVDKSRYKTMEEFIEANLRDQILDLEDRIWQGGLGSVKNINRDEWRAKVENGIYSEFCNTEAQGSEECKPNGVGEVKENGDAELMEVDNSVGEEGKLSVDSNGDGVGTKEMQPMDCDEEQQLIVNGVKDDSKHDCHTESEEVAKGEGSDCTFTALPSHLQLDSRPSSPAGDTRCSTPTLSLVIGSVVVIPAVKQLALELLKVEQGIESKYLNPPLGEDEETKRLKQKEAAAAAVSEFNEMMKAAEAKDKQKKVKRKKETDGDGADTKENQEKKGEDEEDEGKDDSSSSSSSDGEPVKHKTCLERWEESLLVCTNLSQVFVHLNTLDQSVTWSKSVLNARCRLCRRKGDAEHMLLCDACDRGHHMYCLKPPIKEVCQSCALCVLDTNSF
ncbi:Histidine-containing phosphotransfer protein 3 [Desmophyllum pertusum]|uniref:Bromodomain adjacent to zinc finger domain protein 1A n=1 Tax=Desmophyllum pertusum TaxID=174260 RepID=A0A9W9Z9S9_9CNID|nr:Histidine-containing phosphotransfer protein 3 [Desmophyllum pertusum]